MRQLAITERCHKALTVTRHSGRVAGPGAWPVGDQPYVDHSLKLGDIVPAWRGSP
jgi:hypothetical protein